MTSFLTFAEEHWPNRKTKTIRILSAHHGHTLGIINWYGPWRQYVFEAHAGTVWSDGCLTDVQNKLAQLKAERSR